MDIVETNRGGKKIVFQGFCYTKLKTGKSSIFWRCDQEYVMDCKGTLTTSTDLTHPQARHPHSHLSDSNRVDVLKAKAKMKRDALGSNYKPERIFQDATRTINENGRYALADKKSYKRLIQRIRQKRSMERPKDSPMKRKVEKKEEDPQQIVIKQEVIEVIPYTYYDELLVSTVLK